MNISSKVFSGGNYLNVSNPFLIFVCKITIERTVIKFNPAIEDNPNRDIENPESMQPLVFSSDNKKMVGTFFKAAGGEKKPIVLLLHGFPGNENNFDIAHAIKRFGYNVAVIHYRGSWGSDGDFSILNSLQDVFATIDYVSEEKLANELNIDNKQIILIGHSMGGFLSLLASIRYPKIKNIASLAGFNFGFFTDYILKKTQFIETTMEFLSQGTLILHGADGKKLYNEMLTNKDEWNLLKRLTEFTDKNILLVGAEFDYVAPIDLHHKPLVEGLTKVGTNIKSDIYKCGHSFSSLRIKLTKEIIDWLKEIKS